MRDLKFRAWNEDENRWALCEEFSQVKINPTLDQFGGGSKGADLQNMAALKVGTAPLVLMQYTGLKDKNGIEIYEGDIVATPFGYNCEIRWNVNGHWGYWRTVDGATYKEDYWECEVIGNIYENPELLKGA